MVGQAVGNLDGGVGIDAHLIDVKAGTELKRATLLVPSDPDGQQLAMNGFGEVLFGDVATVALALDVRPPGAEVIVDGTVRGADPAATVNGLAPGEHFVMVRKKGFLPYQARVSVKPGEAATLQVSLTVDPEALRASPMSPTVPFVVAGVAGAVAVGGGVAMIFGARPYGVFTDGVAKVNKVDAEHQATLNDTQLGAIQAGHIQAEQGKADWDNWGRTTVVVGGVCVGLGVLVATGGSIWGVSLLGNTPDEAAPAPAK